MMLEDLYLTGNPCGGAKTTWPTKCPHVHAARGFGNGLKARIGLAAEPTSSPTCSWDCFGERSATLGAEAASEATRCQDGGPERGHQMMKDDERIAIHALFISYCSSYRKRFITHIPVPLYTFTTDFEFQRPVPCHDPLVSLVHR